MIGDFLYGLKPRDVGYPVVTPIFYRRTSVVAAASISTQLTVQQDKVLRVGGFSWSATPGAAQTLTSVVLQAQSLVGAGFVDILYHTGTIAVAAPASGAGRADFNDLYVDSRYLRLIMVATFSGAVANTFQPNLWGMLMPIGNLEAPITDGV